ncbi:MAG: hypothetical protein HY444_05630, partial [Nitrospirae bacterium]|nr:hypothetical protein [Nitrospirota bacterium]
MSAPESTARTDTFPPARQNTAQPSFADVIVPRHLHRTFTYSIPASLRSHIRIGSLVRVPLGPSTVPGVVVTISPEGPPLPATTRATPIRVRDILAVVNEPADAASLPDVLELTRQVSDYYLAPWGQCLRLILPALPGARETSRSRRASQA